jgi:CDP-4-dehydro-6-deoxyglucose reductase
MPELLSLSRAARLAGVSRGEIQKEIRKGNLMTFEGEVKLSQLRQVYPNIQVEDSGLLERLKRIQNNVTAKFQPSGTKVASTAGMIGEMDRMRLELDDVSDLMDKYHYLLVTVCERLDGLSESGEFSHDQKKMIEALNYWIQSQLKSIG